MEWMIHLHFSIVIGFFTNEIRGNDAMNICPKHLARTDYLKTFGEKCYRFDKREYDWPTARSICTGEGGDLIQITNQATQNWVMSMFRHFYWNTNGVWIGAHDIHNDNDWRWVTGDKVTWDNWASGQQHGGVFWLENCGNLRRDDMGRWHAKSCSPYTYSYICQYDSNATTPTTLRFECHNTHNNNKTTTTAITPTTTATTTPKTATSTILTTTTTPPTTQIITKTITNTPTPTKVTIPTTIATAVTETMVKTSTPVKGGVTVNDTGHFAEQKSQMNEDEFSGVVVASTLGSIALLTVLSVCFFRSRKKKEKVNLAMHFDNSTCTVRNKLSSKVRMSRHKRSGNYEVLTGCQSINADQNEGTKTKPSNVSVIFKDSGHYSELSEHKMVEKLIVYLPNNDNNAYEEYNIATHKVWENESTQFLNECANSKAVYNSVSDNEAACNAMNEQLETSKKQYDEYENVEGSDNSHIYYIDMKRAADIGRSTVDQYAQNLHQE